MLLKDYSMDFERSYEWKKGVRVEGCSELLGLGALPDSYNGEYFL